MSKPSILYKTTQVSIIKLTLYGDGKANTAQAKVILGSLEVLLDSEASELLVDYFRIIQAYFSLDKPPSFVLAQHQKAVELLMDGLKKTGRKVAIQQDVSGLIQQLGCLHEWAKWDHALMQSSK